MYRWGLRLAGSAVVILDERLEMRYPRDRCVAGVLPTGYSCERTV